MERIESTTDPINFVPTNPNRLLIRLLLLLLLLLLSLRSIPLMARRRVEWFYGATSASLHSTIRTSSGVDSVADILRRSGKQRRRDAVGDPRRTQRRLQLSDRAL